MALTQAIKNVICLVNVFCIASGCSLQWEGETVIIDLLLEPLLHICKKRFSKNLLARAIRQLMKIKAIQTGKEEAKVSLFADNSIENISDPKSSTGELLHLIDILRKVSGLRFNHKTQ